MAPINGGVRSVSRWGAGRVWAATTYAGEALSRDSEGTAHLSDAILSFGERTSNALKIPSRAADTLLVSQFSNRNSTQLIASLNAAITTIGDTGGAPYYAPVGTASNLEDLLSALTLAVKVQSDAQKASIAATVAKNAQVQETTDALTALQATLAADPRVSDSALRAAGFSRRKAEQNKPTVPSIPVEVAAFALPDAQAKLTWKKGAVTPPTTSFLIERSNDGVNYIAVDSTRKTSYVVPQVAPGVPCFFRITATTAMGRSEPSPTVSVYVTSLASKPELKLAA